MTSYRKQIVVALALCGLASAAYAAPQWQGGMADEVDPAHKENAARQHLHGT